VAPALGLPIGLLRLAFLALATAGGTGVLVYAVAWAVLPAADEAGPVPSRRGLDGLATVAVVLGTVLVLQDVGPRLPTMVAVPAVLATAGATLVWGGGSTRRSRPLWLALGVTLILAGGAAVLFTTGELRTIGRSAGGAAVLLAGAGLVAGPWLGRLVRDLAEERRQRIRSQERAEVATHLHDGVLQTLALIQKRAEDGREVRSLARHQERELREWLYGTPGTALEAETVAVLLRRELADVEDRYGVRLEAVLVGDAPLDDAGRALVGAGREAALNAARHAGVDAIDVYLEAEPDRLSLFVRDRGSGFDPSAVPPDRRGLTDSIRARVHRHGGTAEIRSAPGEGTEVELSMPRGEG
jgi:signal transduction histidine kinase